MLAKLHIQLPFELNILLGENYNIYTFEKDGYRITTEIPTSTGQGNPANSFDEMQINGKPCYPANVITFTFQKDSFLRDENSPIDPPKELVQETLNWFLGRLKFVAKAPQVKLIDFPHCQWRIVYLNDDLSELEETKGFIRGRGTSMFSITFLGCDTELWDLIYSLPDDFEPPAWHTLLLDARGALPHIGTSVVLSATALEIFIAELLEKLVKKTKIPKTLWSWLNNRDGKFSKEPSVEEKYDALLKLMTKNSLKTEHKLWKGFLELRNARNTFVHKGLAKVNGKELTVDEAQLLIANAELIIAKIREWIPERYRWPEINHTIELQLIKKFSNELSTPPDIQETQSQTEQGT